MLWTYWNINDFSRSQNLECFSTAKNLVNRRFGPTETEYLKIFFYLKELRLLFAILELRIFFALEELLTYSGLEKLGIFFGISEL